MSSAAVGPPARPPARRLAPAHALLDGGAIDVLSLDAFDTLVLRAVPDPTDAFTVLGHRVVGEGLVAAFVTPALFADLRARAEQRARARRRSQGEFPEVTLEEIHAELPDAVVTSSRTELADVELAIEGALVFADPDVANLARAARARGARVAVVSDTYFSGEQLTALLAGAGLADLDALVVTSSDHRTGKATGLFDVLLRSLDVDPGRVVHVGDHAHADDAAARAHGIASVHLELRQPAFDEVLRREQRFRAAHPSEAASFDGAHGDDGLTAVRARLAAAEPPPGVALHARAHWCAGAAVLGPVFTGFADWVVERAATREVRRLACLMREGALLAPLVGASAAASGIALEAVPLWLSRQVCARAAIERGDYAELRIFVDRRIPPTLGELCALLGVAPADLGDVGAHVDTRLDDVALREAALARIIGDEDLHAGLLARAAELRSRLVRLVESARHPDDRALTIVDLGWHATTQRLLVRALELAGCDLAVAGLYLLTTRHAAEAALEGIDAEGFLAHAGEPPATTDAIVRSPEMLEQLCMGAEGSVLDLDERGQPLRGRVGVPDRQLAEAEAARDGITTFAATFRELRPGVSLGGAAALLRPVLARFVADPTPGEATAFGSWFHDDNFGTATGAMLAHSELLHDGAYADPATLAEVDAYWPAAIVARDAPRGASGAALLVEGSSPTIGLYADTGSGFDELHAVHRPIPVNDQGLSYVQLGIAADGIRSLRLDPVSCHALVRIDRIALRLAVRDRPDPFVRAYTTPEELAAWELRDCTWLAGGLLVTRSTDPQLLLRLAPEVPGEAYAVLASVAFAVMQLPDAAFDDDGQVTIGAEPEQLTGVRAVRELRALASEVRAAAGRHLAAGRRARNGDG